MKRGRTGRWLEAILVTFCLSNVGISLALVWCEWCRLFLSIIWSTSKLFGGLDLSWPLVGFYDCWHSNKLVHLLCSVVVQPGIGRVIAARNVQFKYEIEKHLRMADGLNLVLLIPMLHYRPNTFVECLTLI